MGFFLHRDFLECVVYGLRGCNDSKFCYVGITTQCQQRKNLHLRGKDKSTGEWVRSLEGKIEFVVLARFLCDDSDEAVRYEYSWILILRTMGHPLINQRPDRILTPQMLHQYQAFVERVGPEKANVPFVLSQGFPERFSAFVESVGGLFPEDARVGSCRQSPFENSSMFVRTQVSPNVSMIELKSSLDRIVPMKRRRLD